MKTIYLIVIVLITATMSLTSQGLNKHTWKHRVVLVISNTEDSKTLKNQLIVFTGNDKELEERKLVIYKVFPDKYKYLNDGILNNSSKLYDSYNADKEDFKILLIGLDGSIKIEQYDVLTTKELFSKIDVMPMRRSEIKNENK